MNLRRLTYLGSGLMAFGLALWAGASSLDEARQAEELSLSVEPGTVVTDPSRPWSLVVDQAELAPRVDHRLDGEPIASPSEIDLATLSPGYHFLETELVRRGGRRQRIVDARLTGPFRSREDVGRCGIQLSISAETLQQAVLPVVEELLLEKVRANPYMGPKTELERLDFTLTAGGTRFAVALRGTNRVVAEGWLLIRRKDARRFEVKLLHLGHVSFAGEMRDAADATGAALGAAVGGPLGAAAGVWLVDDFVDRKAREEIKKAIRVGLSQASELALLPERVELLPGRPASAIEVGFCDEVKVMPDGLTGRLRIEPVGGSVPHDWPTPGPVEFGISLPTDGPAREGIQLDLSLDLVNALLDTWAANGVLDELLDESDLQTRTNEALDRWTTLHLEGVDFGLPPVLSTAGGTESGWQIGLAEMDVSLAGANARGWGHLSVSGRGVVEPNWNANTARLELTGRVDQLDVTCAKDSEGAKHLSDCLGPLLSFADVERRIGDAIGPGAEDLPSLDVRALVEEHSRGTLSLEELTVARSRPGVLRFRATARAIDPR